MIILLSKASVSFQLGRYLTLLNNFVCVGVVNWHTLRENDDQNDLKLHSGIHTVAKAFIL
jgi:hypothetical protein